MAIDEGAMIPDLTLAMSDGGPVRLRNYIGQPLVLYFYPKDDTAGCTREAQAFSEHLTAFKAAGAAVLGVSKDNTAKHLKFIDKYDLIVPLASDEDGQATEVFGVWIEKSLYGRKYMGIDRSTFLFGRDGTLVKAWHKVRVPGHVEAVLEAVRALA